MSEAFGIRPDESPSLLGRRNEVLPAKTRDESMREGEMQVRHDYASWIRARDNHREAEEKARAAKKIVEETERVFLKTEALYRALTLQGLPHVPYQYEEPYLWGKSKILSWMILNEDDVSNSPVPRSKHWWVRAWQWLMNSGDL